MPRLLKNLRIDEVSAVFKGANLGALVLIRKAYDDPPYLFNDIMRKADVSDPLRGDRDEPDDKTLSAKLDEVVAEMIVAAPSLHPNRARRWLLHTPHGRELLSQHTTKKRQTIMPQVDILKIATIMEDALNAQVIRKDGESFAQAFAKKYENDIDFRRQWASVTEAKRSVAPTSTVVGNTNVDKSAEAMRQLNKKAEEQGRTFERVLCDPANRELAAQTYM
jgi:hypothetical protein